MLTGAEILTGTVTSCVLGVAAATDNALGAAVVVTTVDVAVDGGTVCEATGKATGEACKAAMLARNRAISSSGPEGPRGAAITVTPETAVADCTAVVA